MFSDLDSRAREILRLLVDNYIATGEPVGSRTLSKQVSGSLSAASIRNVMADLSERGLLHAPHSSAGRLPTEAGLRLFVDGLLEVGDLAEQERRDISERCLVAGRSTAQVLEQAGQALAGLTRHAGLVLAPKLERGIKQIEFVPLDAGRALVIMVTEDGLVENRLLDLPPGLVPSALQQAANYLNARVSGRNLEETRQFVQQEIASAKTELDGLTQKLVQAGLAVWGGNDEGQLIVRGQAALLRDVQGLADIERVRELFQTLETKDGLLKMLEAVHGADGVQIFIGAQSPLFQHSGCALIVAPYAKPDAAGQAQIIGAIGVLGPLRMNYARIIPMVDYTAKLVGRLLG